jgi:hypothetical protein
MRFCSADCLKAYRRRLDELTMMKIQDIDQPLPELRRARRQNAPKRGFETLWSLAWLAI